MKATFILLINLWLGQGSMGIACLWSTCFSLGRRKTGAGIMWSLPHSHVCRLMLVVDRYLSRSCEPLPVALARGMDFLTAWWLGSKPECALRETGDIWPFATFLWKLSGITSVVMCSLRQSPRLCSFKEMERIPPLMEEWECSGRTCGTRTTLWLFL